MITVYDLFRLITVNDLFRLVYDLFWTCDYTLLLPHKCMTSKHAKASNIEYLINVLFFFQGAINYGMGGRSQQPQMRSKLLQQLVEMGFKVS